jgi:UTP--glucose-1-phosphate uridylyltransferase
MIAKLACALGFCAVAAGQDAFEWAGIFSTPLNVYTWTAQKTNRQDSTFDYVDPEMKLVVFPVTTADEASLHALEVQGNQTIQSACSRMYTGDTITCSTASGCCYNLVFDQDAWQTLYPLNTTGIDGIAFFAQHFPTEFENDAHYLKDPQNEDIEPVAEIPEQVAAPPTPSVQVAEDKHTPWAEGIGASVIVNFIALIGVIMMIPALSKAIKSNQLEAEGILGGFAAGAILSCAFFLLLFEATHLVATGWEEEVDVLWRWGTAVLAGIILPSLIHSSASLVEFMPRKANSAEGASGSAAVGDKPDEYVDGQPVAISLAEKLRLFLGVNLGDFFHNLCDGFFLGAGFKGCGSSFGWGIALATVLHEIPQEIADYVILTGPRVGLSPFIALVSNFIAGLGVLLGAVIILGADVGDEVVGLLLAFGGGVYIHIGATECMPKMYAEKLSPLVRMACVASFILGAVLIGLVLLDHEHCVPPTPPGVEAAPAPAGHAHGHR